MNSTGTLLVQKKRMGRPRAFDRSSALHSVMMLFWKQGFDATSYADLTTATGMSKPTLYAAFGDKISLFREAVVEYGRLSAELYEGVLRSPKVRDAVEGALRMAVGTDRNEREPAICFLVQGALTGGPDTQQLRDEMIALRRQNAERMLSRLTQAQHEGDLPRSVDVDVLTEYIASLAAGLGVQAASGSSPEVLSRVVDAVMNVWPLAHVGAERP